MDARDVEQGTQEWRQARVGRITASMVAAVFGFHPYLTRQAALKRMVKEALGDLDDFTNAAMQWGNDNEPTAVKLYEALYLSPDTELSETGFWVKGDIGASPDRLVGDRGLLEIKCPYTKREDERPEFDGIGCLSHYWHQVQAQLYVTDREWCDFLQWTPHDHTMHRVSRDPQWFEQHVDDFVLFMEDFDRLREEMATGGPAERLALSDGWEQAATAFCLAKGEADRIKGDVDAARSALVDLAKGSVVESVSGAGVCVQYVSRKGTVDYKAMAEALAQECGKTVASLEDEYRKEGGGSWRVDVVKGNE